MEEEPTHPAMRTSMCVSAASQQTCIRVDMSCVAWLSWARSQSRVSSTTFVPCQDTDAKGGQPAEQQKSNRREHLVCLLHLSSATQHKGREEGGEGGGERRCSWTEQPRRKRETTGTYSSSSSSSLGAKDGRSSWGFGYTARRATPGRFGCVRCAASSPPLPRPQSVASRSPCGCPRPPPIERQGKVKVGSVAIGGREARAHGRTELVAAKC